MTSLKSVSQEFDSGLQRLYIRNRRKQSLEDQLIPREARSHSYRYPFPPMIVPPLTCAALVLRPPSIFGRQPFPSRAILHATRPKFTVRQIAGNKRFLCSLPRLLGPRFQQRTNGSAAFGKNLRRSRAVRPMAVRKYTSRGIKWPEPPNRGRMVERSSLDKIDNYLTQAETSLRDF